MKTIMEMAGWHGCAKALMTITFNDQSVLLRSVTQSEVGRSAMNKWLVNFAQHMLELCKLSRCFEFSRMLFSAVLISIKSIDKHQVSLGTFIVCIRRKTCFDRATSSQRGPFEFICDKKRSISRYQFDCYSREEIK